MGCEKQAHKFTWTSVARSFNQDAANKDSPFVEPVPIDCAKFALETAEFERDSEKPLNVVCVKYGTKYGADYVNKLFYGVK